MNEKNEKTKPEKKNALPQPPTTDLPKSEGEVNLDLLKEELPAAPKLDDVPGIDPTEDLNIAEEVEEAEAAFEIPETEFKKPLDQSERKHYQMVLKANREAIAILRKKVAEAQAEIKTLNEKLETKSDS